MKSIDLIRFMNLVSEFKVNKELITIDNVCALKRSLKECALNDHFLFCGRNESGYSTHCQKCLFGHNNGQLNTKCFISDSANRAWGTLNLQEFLQKSFDKVDAYGIDKFCDDMIENFIIKKRCKKDEKNTK